MYFTFAKSYFYYSRKNLKKVDKTNKFKLAEQTWHEKFELPDG